MKLKRLKNLEEKKQKNNYVHIFTGKYKLDWPLEVRLKPTRSVRTDITTFTFVNPNWVLKTVKDHPEGRLLFQVWFELQKKQKTSRTLDSNIAFDAFSKFKKKKKKKIMAMLRMRRENPLNASFCSVYLVN